MLKTGATTARERLPVHYDTTLRCIPHHAVYSDLEENIEGHHVYDALALLDPNLVQESEQFELYRKQKEKQAHGNDLSDLQTPSGTIKEDGAGWRLDKWKFLPLLNKTYSLRPEAKWFVFMEADSHVVWSNLLAWLADHDPTTTLYLGSANFMGDDLFAHGGSSYAVSNTAMRLGAQEYARDPQGWNDQVRDMWAGDAAVGRLMHNIGIEVTNAWPMIQGETPLSLDYKDDMWCRPVVSFHHMTPDLTTELWRFEQAWLAGSAPVSSTSELADQIPSDLQPIRHRDIFNAFVRPFLFPHSGANSDLHTGPKGGRTDNHPRQHRLVRTGWDNMSGDRVLNNEAENMTEEEAEARQSAERCEALCKTLRQECLQWKYDPESQVCAFSRVVRVGQETDKEKKPDAEQEQPPNGKGNQKRSHLEARDDFAGEGAEYTQEMEEFGAAMVDEPAPSSLDSNKVVSGWFLDRIKIFLDGLSECDREVVWQ